MPTVMGRSNFDYVCASLRCPRCGETAADPCSIDLQTQISVRPALHRLGVGSGIRCLSDLRSAGYLPTRETAPTGPIRIVETWSCPRCATGFLWALLTVDHGVLTAVEPVELTEAILGVADYVTSEALQLATMEPPDEISRLRGLAPSELIHELSRLEGLALKKLSTIKPTFEHLEREPTDGDSASEIWSTKEVAVSSLLDLKRELEHAPCYLSVIDYTSTHSLLRFALRRGAPIFYKILACGGLFEFKGPFPQEGGPYRLIVESTGVGSSMRVVIRDVDGRMSVTCADAGIYPGNGPLGDPPGERS